MVICDLVEGSSACPQRKYVPASVRPQPAPWLPNPLACREVFAERLVAGPRRGARLHGVLPGWPGRSPVMSDHNLRRRRGAQQPASSRRTAQSAATTVALIGCRIFGNGPAWRRGETFKPLGHNVLIPQDWRQAHRGTAAQAQAVYSARERTE